MEAQHLSLIKMRVPVVLIPGDMGAAIGLYLLNVVMNYVGIGLNGLTGKFFNGTRHYPVVGIHMHYIVSGRGFNPALPCLRKAAVFLIHNLHIPARKLFQDRLQHFHAAVRGAVIDKDKLRVLPALGQK